MFKFLHAADLHLDSPLRGLERYVGCPADEVRTSSRRALENLVTLAIGEKVAFVVIAGDVYDGDLPDYGACLFLNDQMLKLQRAGIPVYLIQGNHDAESHMTRASEAAGQRAYVPARIGPARRSWPAVTR